MFADPGPDASGQRARPSPPRRREKRKAPGPAAAPRSARARPRGPGTPRLAPPRASDPRQRRKSGAHNPRHQHIIRAHRWFLNLVLRIDDTRRRDEQKHTQRSQENRGASRRDRRHAAYSRQTPNGLTKPSDPDTTANSDTKRVSNGVHSRDCSAHHGQGLLAARTPSAPHPER